MEHIFEQEGFIQEMDGCVNTCRGTCRGGCADRCTAVCGGFLWWIKVIVCGSVLDCSD